MAINNTLFIKFKGLAALKIDLLGALQGRKSIQAKNEIYFDSPQSFRNFMTLQKLELLAMISHANPKSIYDLAKISGRALAAVQKDCQMLASTNFIKLNKQKIGRGSLVPKLSFAYDRIIVQLPEHPYALRIEAA